MVKSLRGLPGRSLAWKRRARRSSLLLHSDWRSWPISKLQIDPIFQRKSRKSPWLRSEPKPRVEWPIFWKNKKINIHFLKIFTWHTKNCVSSRLRKEQKRVSPRKWGALSRWRNYKWKRERAFTSKRSRSRLLANFQQSINSLHSMGIRMRLLT